MLYNFPTTIVFADRQGRELSPFTHQTCVALLPVAAKPLIEYTLDSLSEAKIQKVLIVISADTESIRKTLGYGERWGMQFSYFLSRGQEDPAQILLRLGNTLTDERYLLIRADVLRSLNIGEFLSQTIEEKTSVVATIQQRHIGLCLLRKRVAPPFWEDSHVLQWDVMTTQRTIPNLHYKEVEGQFSFLDSFRSYHQANLDVAAGVFKDLVLPIGRQINKKLRIGYKASVLPCSSETSYTGKISHASSSTAFLENSGLVGAYSRVHAQAALINQVVLSHGVIVDRHALLNNTVVLPNTYIGEGVELRNAVVWGNLLVRIDTGAIVQIIDRFLLDDLNAGPLKKYIVESIHRSLGILTCLVSLPLWPLAISMAIFQNPKEPSRKVKLRGNLIWRDSMGVAHPQDFTTWEWSTHITVLKHLPKLFAVISGQIRMIGVSPLSPQQAEACHEPWEKVRDLAPVGLIGPSQLMLPHNAPEEEHLLVDACYAKTRHFGTDMLWLLKGIMVLFTKRAWSSKF